MGKNKFFIYFLNKKFLIYKEIIENALKKALFFLKKRNIFFEVYVVDNRKIKAINKKYRQQNKVTNVISLVIKEKFLVEGGYNYLGEIYLAPDYIKKQKQDLVEILIHGLVHLFGYTHKKKDDTIKMRKIENKILKKI